MAVTVASLQAVLDLEKKGFDSGLKEAKGSLGGFKSAIGGLLGVAGGFLAATAISTGMGLITSGIGEATAAAREAIAIDKQLEQVLKSTGGAAGVTADQARSLADELGRVTNFEDDSILSGENLLLTFTKIGKDVFPRATETMLDMSQALGQDLKSSAIQLGKALNDPLKGFSALQRVGVTFSATQKQQIKDFMAVGDIAKAQGVILDELAREFGGSAKALADPVTQLSNAWGNLQEKVGVNVILPVLNSLAQAVLPAVNAAIDGFKTAISGLTEGELKTVSDSIMGLMQIFIGLNSAFNEVGKGILAIARGLGLADENSTALGLTVKALVVVLGAFIEPLRIVGYALTAVGAALQVLGTFVKIAVTGWNQLGSVMSSAASKSSGVMAVWNALISAGNTLYQIIKIIEIAWRNLINTMAQRIGLPSIVTPGSPTPLEMGLRGIIDALNNIPKISFGWKLGDDSIAGFIAMVNHDTPGALEKFAALVKSGKTFQQASKGWASESLDQLKQVYNMIKSGNIPGVQNMASSLSTISPMGGGVPLAATAGSGGNTYITINISGMGGTMNPNNNQSTEAIRMTIQMLRAQLNR